MSDPSKLYVPGHWFCPKCDFRHVLTFVSATDGSLVPKEGRPGPCPNCDVSMWPVSWERDARDAWHLLDREFQRTRQLEQQLFDEGLIPVEPYEGYRP